MKIIVHEANGLQVGQRREDGYINLTKMAQANGKKLNDYLRLETTKAFLDELSTVTGIPVTAKNGLIQVRQSLAIVKAYTESAQALNRVIHRFWFY
jgi:hypothetical protein